MCNNETRNNKSLLTYHRGQKVLHSYSPRQASLPLENQKPQSEMSDGYRWKKRYASIFCDYVYISRKKTCSTINRISLKA